MESTAVIQEMNEIFRDELDDNQISLQRETTARDVEGWDSLTHIQLIVAIEKHFKIRFSSSEIAGFLNVGEMADAISKKKSA